MPVMAVRIGSPSSGTSVLKVIELHPHVDPKMIQLYLNSMKSMFSSTSSVSSPPMQKEHFKEVLAFAQSQREREVLSYAVFKASGMSASRARKHFGLENIAHRATNVDKAICEAKAIRKCIDSLATTQEVALLQSYGIPYENPDSDISSEGEHSDEDLSTEHASLELPPLEKISVMLKESLFNWFDVVEKLEHICQLDDTEDSFVDQLQHVYSMLVSSSNLKFEENEMFLMQQSYCAYTNERLIRVNTCQQQVDELNGMIVEENVTLDPEEYIGVDDLSNDVTKKLITKRRIAIQRHARYLKAKKIAENNFLARKSSSHTRGILKDYPDIGQTIEDFVQSQNIGADAWRRTGVLTFDGNTRVGKRVTFEHIRQHLESKYNRKFSYGTTVQLCVARNKRRQSAKNYRGVAHVTSRRARKGFTLKFNPDSHWSNALYRGLSMIQYTDGSNIININRDDAAGFRLDSMTTHRLHKTLQVQGKDTQTTHTDFVNKYPSTLQTTSYNFSKTATTEEVCVGIVKASGVYPKNPAQHLSDLEMIEKSELQSPFINPLTEERKQIECVRVDGASDEGPSHEEIQFYWTERHYNNGYAVTLITTRSSGSSYLNRVELQNGCMAVAHANLFIPSTLAGTNMSTETGKLDREKFTTNMDLATDVYLNRVNGCPCGATTISLLKGADSSDKQAIRSDLLQFLKGSKKQKDKLKLSQPDSFQYFQKIWSLRERHLVRGQPSQYMFQLACCYQKDCPHPVCQSGTGNADLKWYPGGPSVQYVPFPILDPERHWGRSSCDDCSGKCSGHYLQVKDVMISSGKPVTTPPSIILKEAFQSLDGKPADEAFINSTAEKTLLQAEEVRMWFDHLFTISENRKRGALKAAKTRREKKQTSNTESYFCGVCREQYVEFTDTQEKWIGCDSCSEWYHFVCVGLDPTEPDPEVYCCSICLS